MEHSPQQISSPPLGNQLWVRCLVPRQQLGREPLGERYRHGIRAQPKAARRNLIDRKAKRLIPPLSPRRIVEGAEPNQPPDQREVVDRWFDSFLIPGIDDDLHAS